MKKTLVFILVLALLGTFVPYISFPGTVNAAYSSNLLTGVQSTFEDASVPSGWTAFSGGTLSTSTTVAHSGSRSLKMASRSYTWTSPQYNIYSIIKNGGPGTYQISFWVYVDAQTNNPSNGRVVLRGTSANQYSFFISGQSFALLSDYVATRTNQWTQYVGTLNVTNTADLTSSTGDFYLMIDTLETASGQNIYFDDVEITKSIDNLLGGGLGTFEQSTVPSGWAAFGGGSLSTSTTVAHSGSYSLKLSGRTQTWYAPAYNIYSILKAGGAGTYYISLWARVDSLTTSPSSGNLLIRGNDSNDDNSFINYYYGNYFATIQSNVSMPVNTWVKYTAAVEVLASDLTRETGTFNLCVDSIGLGTNQNLYIDDVQIMKPAVSTECWLSEELSFTSSYTNLPYVTGNASTFEDGTANGWTAFGGGTLSVSSTVKHGGSYSIKLANRAASYYSPAKNIYSILKTAGPGTYNISFWVYVDSLSTSPCDGRMLIRGDSVGQYSFFTSGQSWGAASGLIPTEVNTWVQYNGSVTVTATDLSSATGNFNLMIDSLEGTATQNVYFDDFTITSCPTTEYLTGTGADGTFEGGSLSGWSAFGGGTLSASTTVVHNGSYSAKLANRPYTWASPQNNIYNIIKLNGAGTYTVSMWVYADNMTTSPSNGRLVIRADSVGQYSFLESGQSFGPISGDISTTAANWTLYTSSLTVTESDISNATGNFSLMIDTLSTGTSQNLYIDDVRIYKAYTNPAMDVTMDVTFTGPDDTTMIMPAFWDGTNVWKVRFAPTQTGLWSYTTSCSNTADKGLQGLTGYMGCTAYTGDLALYQNGFVKTTSNTRYFTYDDGTPFFYIGDTHWTMPTEPYTTVFQSLITKRLTQGFTVYQSEPIGASYDLSDGLTGADIAGFTDLDRRFQYIADAGLLHSNAQLFFTDELVNNSACYSTEYLQKLARYWVARYASYPVLWTTAQESDDDFYGNFTPSTNPWKTVFSAIHTYDPYEHPQTAHQENTNETRASDSAFKDLSGYSWFSSQWAPAKNAVPDFDVAKDYYNNGGTRPTVLYEGEYEYLATNDFGARMQGWTAYLNGMCGLGYGAQDIWYYNTNMYEDSDYTSYGIYISIAMRQVLWTTSQDFDAATALGTYMKDFFNDINWWQLTPRFDDTTYFANNSSYYSVASILNDTYVAYFYNTTTNTGTLKGMDSVAYTAKWYNPRTGAYTTIGTITPSSGQWTIPAKPDGNDWVLLVYHT